MLFIEKVAEEARRHGGSLRVRSVFVGLSYVVAVLENGNSGLGFVFKDQHLAGCNVALPKRPLAGSTVKELLDFTGKSFVCNSIAMAVANAVLSPLVSPRQGVDFIDHFHLQPGMKVGMVGHFRPLEPLIRKQGAELVIFDLHPDFLAGVHGANDIPELLPQCDAAIITGTSIINETFDDLLTHAENCRSVVVLGPSTPLYPKCYEGTPVSCAAGVTIGEPELLVQTVVEAGGVQAFGKYVNKVNVYLS